MKASLSPPCKKELSEFSKSPLSSPFKISKCFPFVLTEIVCKLLGSCARPKPKVFIFTPLSFQAALAEVTTSSGKSVEILSPSAKTNDNGL